MAEAGTLLSDLEGGSGRPSDGDLVDSILADLNQPNAKNPMVAMPGSAAPPPPLGNRMPMQPTAPIQQGYPTAMDPSVPTAHLIGRDHPTEADFQRMMAAAQGPLPQNSMAPQMAGAIAQMPPQQQVYEEPKKNWQGQWIDELKQPILVAIVLFVMTLPAVNLLAVHYAPRLLRPGGDFTTVGLVVRAFAGGALFWAFQRVIAPLVSL